MGGSQVVLRRHGLLPANHPGLQSMQGLRPDSIWIKLMVRHMQGMYYNPCTVFSAPTSSCRLMALFFWMLSNIPLANANSLLIYSITEGHLGYFQVSFLIIFMCKFSYTHLLFLVASLGKWQGGHWLDAMFTVCLVWKRLLMCLPCECTVSHPPPTWEFLFFPASFYF